MTQPQILAKVSREDFFGRDAELREIARQSSTVRDGRGVIVLAAPDSGAAELLRQSYDQLFSRRGNPVPLHFAFRHSDATPAMTARRFFQSLLQQFVAYRRVKPALCNASLTFQDLSELALPSDYEVVSNLIEGFQ